MGPCFRSFLIHRSFDASPLTSPKEIRLQTVDCSRWG
jgi:hypothetical protein